MPGTVLSSYKRQMINEQNRQNLAVRKLCVSVEVGGGHTISHEIINDYINWVVNVFIF